MSDIDKKNLQRAGEEALTAYRNQYPAIDSIVERFDQLAERLFSEWVASLKEKSLDIESFPPPVVEAYLTLLELLNSGEYHLDLTTQELPNGLSQATIVAKHLTNDRLAAPVSATVIYSGDGRLATRKEIIEAMYKERYGPGTQYIDPNQETGIEVVVSNMFALEPDKRVFLDKFRKTVFGSRLEESVVSLDSVDFHNYVDFNSYMPALDRMKEKDLLTIFRQPQTLEDKAYKIPKHYQLLDKLTEMMDY